MNDDLDPLDETLAHGLRALAPSEFELDADAALGSMRPALHRARARRRLAVSTSALGALAVVVVGAAALRQGPTSRVNIRQRTRPTASALVHPSTTRVPVTTTQPAIPAITTPDHVPSTTRPDRQPSGSLPTPTVTTPTTTKTTTPPSRGATTTTAPTLVTKTYAAHGGHMTITFVSGRLTLDSYAPAAGYQSDLHKNTTNDIEIRFSKGNLESRIRIRVENGRLSSEITGK
jgi:hypothetical protein